jgi:Glycosyltransferase (GlcNAc)
MVVERIRVSDDEDYSYRSGSGSRNSSCKSFNRNYGVDWDEIDSITEESLSVASSVSSGHLHRTRRRMLQPASSVSQLDYLESGSLSRYTTNISSTVSRSGSQSSGSSGSGGGNRNKTPSKPSLTHQQRKQRQRNWQKIRRLFSIGVIVLVAALSIHLCSSYLSLIKFPNSFIGIGVDRIVRRALSQSADHYAAQHWPHSVRKEQSDFELLPHPANNKIILSVPRFFLTREDGQMLTLGRKRPISRTMVDLVGQTTFEGSRDFSVRTIFVGIPSYRDKHCRFTVESIFARAKYPERIRVGVVDQLEDQHQSCDLPMYPCTEEPRQALCQYRQQIDVYEMDYKLAVGPVFARHIVNRLYRGEYYALQITAHTAFTKNWDVELIEQLEETGNEMGVITTYLDDASGNIDDKTGTSLKKSRLILCNAGFHGVGHERRLHHEYNDQPDMLPSIAEMPQLQPFWSSTFSFSRGHFILTVPYDHRLSMIRKLDEEISMAIRAFTHGYDFYTPVKSVCFDTARNEKLPSVYEVQHQYKGLEKNALRRLDILIGMDSEAQSDIDPNEIYGLGIARPLAKFHTAFGIHPREHITEQKLCNFVSTGYMHKLFHKYLREDGMGVDYGNIHFRFHELQNNHDA